MANDGKKYYWLKLKRDFFKRHDMRIIEAMPNGKDYVLFYLKLLVESIDHEGHLRFSDTIPYSPEMLSVITDTNIDIVKAAINLFTELQLMEVYDDGTIFIAEVNALIGSETKWAAKKRVQRGGEDNVPLLSSKCPTEIELEKEIEIDKEIDKDKESMPPVKPSATPTKKKYGEYGWVRLTDKEHDRLIADLGQDEFNRCVNYIDESAQSNGNKNRWKDWNLVIRKCSRDRWGLGRVSESDKAEAERKAALEAWERGEI